MIEKIAETKLVAVREGNYTIYVFQDIVEHIFIMCTRPPNWQTPNIEIGEEGFLQYKEVKAGEEYYSPETETTHKYSYSNVYFMNFVKKSNITNTEIIL